MLQIQRRSSAAFDHRRHSRDGRRALPQPGHGYDGYQWEEVTTPTGFVRHGCRTEVPAAASSSFPISYVSIAPRLDYEIRFAEAGLYYVWVRGYAANGKWILYMWVWTAQRRLGWLRISCTCGLDVERVSSWGQARESR